MTLSLNREPYHYHSNTGWYNRTVKKVTGHATISPLDYPLLPGESVLHIEEFPERTASAAPSSLHEILRLTRASTREEIGKTGPAVAALSRTTQEGQDTPDHLRLYEVVFGRDSLRVAIDLISSYPELARTTTLTLARLQGLEDNASREEELGRIVHEARSPDDPIAVQLTTRRGWGWPYYGTVDATPEFIRTLTAYCKRSEENYGFLGQRYLDLQGNERTISHSLELALLWIERRLASNQEGILEFKSVLPFGIENQVWKDSWDAYHHADGAIANHEKGVSSIEVQVTTYDALIDAAELYEDIMDNPNRARELRDRARALKRAIMEHYWVDEKGGYFALGTDRDDQGALRQLKVRASNMGHALNSRLLQSDDTETIKKRDAIIAQILSPEMLNVSGIRTLASDEVRFRPGAYHNGSVWLWDTHHIAKGLRRHGFTREANDLDLRMLSAVNQTRMFPEYVRGDTKPVATVNTRSIILWDDINKRENHVEQPPQEVQAWTVAAILATKQRIGLDA